MTNLDIENKATFAATAFGWWRKDIPLEISYAYWRDIHGVLAARIPGLFQYRQLHLKNNKKELFKAIPSVETDLPQEEQPNGIAQLLFLNQEGIQMFGTHKFVAKYIFEDEQNLVERNATLVSPNQTAKTIKDVIDEKQPQGKSFYPSFVIAFKKSSL